MIGGIYSHNNKYLFDFDKYNNNTFMGYGESMIFTPLPSEVPQGANRGPKLFIVFVNDITNRIKHCHSSTFAGRRPKDCCTDYQVVL